MQRKCRVFAALSIADARLSAQYVFWIFFWWWMGSVSARLGKEEALLILVAPVGPWKLGDCGISDWTRWPLVFPLRVHPCETKTADFLSGSRRRRVRVFCFYPGSLGGW